MSKLNPVTIHREFFGIPGVLFITLTLPLLIVVLQLLINANYSLQGVSFDIEKIAQEVPRTWEEFCALCFDKNCWKAYLAWFSVLAVCDVYFPGKDIQGVELRDRTRLTYRINGLSMSSALVAIILARAWTLDNYYLPELDFLYKNQLRLICVTVIFSFLLSFIVYFISFIPLRKPNGMNTFERVLSINGNTGNQLYDWFIGRELNPRIGAWDIKLFCELRPGMLLLLLINLSGAHHQYHSLGKVSDSMFLTNVLQAFYIFDGILNEEGLLTMMDISTDGFGFMLAFGDLAWLPGTYSLQTRYLSLDENFHHLGAAKFWAIVALLAVGYYIFHSSNQQKSDFKQRKLDHMKSISTPTGSKLLIEGWWGLSQHINYFGDWIIGWSWCLPTGSKTPLTYFYVIYFAILLLHRQKRDEAKCRAKYGRTWEEYEAKVPYKIVPYVY